MPKVLSVSLLLAASITFPLVAQINARQSVSGRIVPALEACPTCRWKPSTPQAGAAPSPKPKS